MKTYLLTALVALLVALPASNLLATTRDTLEMRELGHPRLLVKPVAAPPARLSFGVHGGWGTRVAPIVEGAKPVMEGLTRGFALGLDAYHDLTRYLSIGAEYNLLHASKENGDWWIDIHYVGPTALFTVPSRRNRANFFVSGSPFGYVAYAHKIPANRGTSKGTGGNVGSALFIGGHFARLKHVSVVLRVGLIVSSLDRFTQKENGQTTVVKLAGVREDLTHVRVSLGLRVR
jgi:hypothetical protein